MADHDRSVRIFEVGPRDGLQNESRPVSFKDKLWFIEELTKAGVKDLEVGAFVRTDRVPQLADTDRIYQDIGLGRVSVGGARCWALVPNRKGLERAISAGVRHIALFTAATEAFAQRNIGMTIEESLREFKRVIEEARRISADKKAGAAIQIRGYVSTAFGCPFEGAVPPKKALRVIEKLAGLGVDQISIGDTIGVAIPSGRQGSVEAVIKPALAMLGVTKTAAHFHDTRGTALANALRSLELGVRIFDSSAGGLGGCPFAPGATGNLATEDLVYMLNGMGFRTGIDLELLSRTSLELARRMKRPLGSRYLQAFASRKA